MWFIFVLSAILFSSQMKRQPGNNFAVGACILATILFISLRAHMVKKARYSRPGSVADLVRRGQLRSDRRGMYDPHLHILLVLFCVILKDTLLVRFIVKELKEKLFAQLTSKFKC